MMEIGEGNQHLDVIYISLDFKAKWKKSKINKYKINNNNNTNTKHEYKDKYERY
jgi:hypothetical protein